MSDRPLVTAMVGLTISSSEAQKLIDLLTGPVGWEALCEVRLDRDLDTLWGIAPGSAGERFTILRSPGADRGMIRVVTGIERERTRPVDTRWSGAEILVTRDVDGLHDELHPRDDFLVRKKPADADFTDVGANIHRGFFGSAPGGSHLMFTMAVTQARDYDFPTAEARVGHIFSVPLVTSEYERSFAFYRDVLGMIPVLEDSFDEGLWHRVWKLPIGAHVELSIFKGDAHGFGLGGVEMQGYDEEHIDPIPVDLNHFDGGACLVTYTTKDLDAVFAAVSKSSDARILSQPMAHAALPYRGGRAFCFAGPSGERLEVCETPWAGE